MKKTKILALLLSMTMLSSAAMPGTLAIESAVDGSAEYECGFDYEHTHDETCWEAELSCTEEEAAGHTHTVENGCYEIVPVTLCGIEFDEHEHTEECEADCEITVEHDHTDECLTEVKETLTCEEPETEGHVHGDGCFSEPVLNCGYPEEHTHTDECYPAEEADICEFCGEELPEDGAHIECWDLYEEPEDEPEDEPVEEPEEGIIVIDGPQIGERIWINSGSVVYKTQDADDGWTLRGNYEVEITDIITDNNGKAVMYEFEFTSVIGELLLHNYKYVKAENTSEEEPDDAIEDDKLVDDIYGVTVAGELPAGTELSVEEASVGDIARLDPELAYLENIENEYIAYDISLMSKEDEEIQPDGTVTVTLDVSEVAEDGEDVIVYHVHENEDGTVETELLGPLTVQDDKISFEMTRFSYVLVFNGTAEYVINDVETFYSASFGEGGSGNGHYQFLGIYYDSNGDTHFLLATVDDTPEAFLKHFESFYIDDIQYLVANKIEEDKIKQVQATYSAVVFQDENANVFENVPITEKGESAKGFFDINIGKVKVGRNFEFAVSQDMTMPDKSNGWNILSAVTVNLEYHIVKTVAHGTSADVEFSDSITVERGDWVIYKIVIDNSGSVPLNGMSVIDTLPTGAFVEGTVQMSIDLTGETNWQPFQPTMFNNYSSAAGKENVLYIKAQVNPNLEIHGDTIYENSVIMTGTNMPTVTDTADIVVKVPTTGTLTVSKAVTSENPNDPAPDTEFTFTIHSEAENAGPFSYEKSDETTGSVANDGTFTLKNGESIKFNNFPVGKFTVTETNAAGFATKVNGESGTTYNGDMTPDASPVVAFENQFSMRTATLSITKKVGQEYEYDILPDDNFTFTVMIEDGSDTPISCNYTIGNTTGTIQSGGTITLAKDQTAVIEGIPVGSTYTISEISDEDYTTEVNGKPNNFITGTIVVGGNEVTFTNTYKRHTANLTITKEAAQGETFYPGESFIFNVTGGDLDGNITVVINGAGSVTIEGLTLGQSYTVTEDTSWSYRYTAYDAEQEVTLTAKGINTVTFTNTKSTTNTKWLYSEAYCRNIFSGETDNENINPKKDNET